jgi:hypothetical protein
MDTRASRCAMWKLHAPPSRYKEFNPAKERTAKLTPNRVTFLNGPNRDFLKRRRHPLRAISWPVGLQRRDGISALRRCSPPVLNLSQRRETIAVPPMPSTRAAPVDRSMHRPFTNGPRSFIRTVTLRPVKCEVTVTCEPNGLARCAAVIAFGSMRSPDAVRPPP